LKLDDERDHDDHHQPDDDERGEGAHTWREDSDGVSTSRIEFITRNGCPLCEAALEPIEDAARRYGVTVVVVDVDLDLALLTTFDHRVPVVRDGVTGVVLAEGLIDRRTAAAAIRAASRS
jgi:hypothetical protein